MSLEANQHENMSCFDGGSAFILAGQNHMPQNLNLETYHPPKHVKFRQATQCTFRCLGSPSLETYPTKTCKVLGIMFQPHPPIFHVLPCDPHPCPMTHP